jgi:hypothetical protein
MPKSNTLAISLLSLRTKKIFSGFNGAGMSRRRSTFAVSCIESSESIKSASVYQWREVAIADYLPESRRSRCRHLIPVFDAGQKSRSRKYQRSQNLARRWRFSTPREPVCGKFVLILKRLCDLEFPEGQFFGDGVQQKRSG